MATLDPTDLKIQVRLADLHRVAGESAQAVARYDAIGGLLQRGGAHEEAIAFFRKALELDPNDSGARTQIIRSHLAVNDLVSAVAALEAAPRNAETRMLLAHAMLSRRELPAAAAAAQEAVQFEPDNEAARAASAADPAGGGESGRGARRDRARGRRGDRERRLRPRRRPPAPHPRGASGSPRRARTDGRRPRGGEARPSRSRSD